MRVRRQEQGFALVELLAVMSLSIVMLSAVLLTFEGFQKRADGNARLNESQAQTRQALGQLARELRNLASPTPQQPQAIDSAAAYDLIFQTVNPSAQASANITNVQRVRYCLDAPASGDASLWVQTHRWNSAAIQPMQAVTGCPAPASADSQGLNGWTEGQRVVTGVTNRAGNRPLFLYNAAIKTDITAITAQLWARAGAEAEPRLGLLRTQVFLRNQNQAPTAAFDVPTVTNGRVVLNASASTDPEGDELRYDWYLDQVPDCRSGTPPTPRGNGVVHEMTDVARGTHTVTLIVYDSAGLCSRTTRPVTV